MKFPAGSLAAIAVKTPSDRSYDVRHLTVNAKEHGNSSGRYEETSSPQILNNKNALPEVVSNILSKLADLQEVVECDPTVESDQDDRQLKNLHGYDHESNAFGDDAEFGILSPSCGVGRKCQEGLCVDAEGWNLNDRLSQRSLQSDVEIAYSSPAGNQSNSSSIDGNETMPQIEGFNSTFIETMQYLCEFGELVGYDCDCYFELEAYLGNATCTTPMQCVDQTSVCDQVITNCNQTSTTFFLKGAPGAIDKEFCLHFIEPYEQSVCYTTSTVDFGNNLLPECKISLDGDQCSSCDVYSYGQANCYNFDCGNTPLAANRGGSVVGNTCVLPAHTVGLYLATFGCPECNLCGENMEMTSPATYMELFNSTYECGYVQNVALQGFFTETSCALYSSIAQEPCGCAVVGNETETDDEIDDVNKETEPPTSIFINNGEVCKICPDGVSNPDGMLSMPGSKTISCAEIETAGLDGSIVGEELCEAVQDRAAGPCCGAPESPVVEEDIEIEAPAESFCSLCGPGMSFTNDIDTLVSVPTQGIYSCGELIEMGKKGTLDENGICLLVQLSANTPCRCVAEGPTVAPTTVTVGDPYDVPSTATRTSLAVALATVGVTAIVTHFLC